MNKFGSENIVTQVQPDVSKIRSAFGTPKLPILSRCLRQPLSTQGVGDMVASGLHRTMGSEWEIAAADTVNTGT